MPSSTIVHLTWAALFLHTLVLATIPEPVSRLWKWLFPSDVDRLEAELGQGLTPFARMHVDCVHGDNDLEADGLELLETISR